MAELLLYAIPSIVPVQFLAALMLRWLRHRSGSVVPGVLAHAAANLGAGLLAG